MATYIKDLKEDNGDITRPVTEAGAVLLSGGGDLETELTKYVTAEDIASTSALTPPVATNMIENGAVTTAKIDNGAVTSAKIDWSTVSNSDLQSFPVEDFSSEITNLPAHSAGTNNYTLKRWGNLYVLNVWIIWMNSVSSQTEYTIGKMPAGYAPPAAAAGNVTFVNGDSGALVGVGRISVDTSGNIKAIGNGSRSGLTAIRGQVVWFA